MDAKLYEYCKYYKGESFCPFSEHTVAWHYWHAEVMYFEHRYERVHEQYEEDARTWLADEYPELRDILRMVSIPIQAKGMIAFTIADMKHMSPMSNLDWIKHYGKYAIKAE